jgi:hypothetical protein
MEYSKAIYGIGTGEIAACGTVRQDGTVILLADYKMPRNIFAIKCLQRVPNGKPDYPDINADAAAHVEKVVLDGISAL